MRLYQGTGSVSNIIFRNNTATVGSMMYFEKGYEYNNKMIITNVTGIDNKVMNTIEDCRKTFWSTCTVPVFQNTIDLFESCLYFNVFSM